MIVRDATQTDIPAITALYAHSVRTGSGTFELTPPSETEMAARMAGITGPGLPYLVAEMDGAFAGYAYAGPFRLRAAYRYMVEDSVYVAPDAQGRGVGRALLQALIDRCTAMGLRQMAAVIGDSANQGSIALHAACGFRPAGGLQAAGWKFDDWRDIVFMQRPLGPGSDTPPGTPSGPAGVDFGR